MNMKNIFSDYNVTINEQQNIMDIMDKYRKLIYEGQEVSHAQFEKDIVDVFGGFFLATKHSPVIEYHFCELVAKGFAEEGRWEEVFQVLYGEFPKYGGKIY